MLSFKKILFSVLVFFVLLIVAIIIVANSSFVIKKAADIFAPEYQISYDDISGNVFTGVTVSGLKFENQVLSQKVQFSWNPSKILYKTVAINTLSIEGLDIDVVKALLDSFPSDDNSSSEPIQVVITVDKVHIDVLPFEEEGISFSKSVVDVEDIAFSNNTLDVAFLRTQLETNIANISLEASLDDGIVNIDTLRTEEIDSIVLEKLFLTNEQNITNVSPVEKEQDIGHATEDEPHPLMPKKVVLNYFFASMKSRIYHIDKNDSVDISSISLEIKDTVFDVKTLIFEQGAIDLNGKTNLLNISYEGNMKKNELMGSIILQPHEAFYRLYNLPIRKDAISDVTINLDISEAFIKADLQTKAKQILLVEKEHNRTTTHENQVFNVDINMLKSHIKYTIQDATLAAETNLLLSTPYAKDISISNTFMMDKNISYRGEINAKKMIGIHAKMLKPLNHLNISYSGDSSSIETKISSQGLKGNFVSSDFKKGVLHLETTKSMKLDQLFTLPGELNGTKVNVMIDVPVDFEQIIPLKASANITSNITNIDAEILYDEKLQAKITSVIPKDSLLKNFDENIKWSAINPLVLDVDVDKNNAVIKLKSKALSTQIKYLLESGHIDGTINLAGLVTDIKGIVAERMFIKTNISSMTSLMTSVKSFYKIEDLPLLEGTLNASVEVLKLEQLNLSLSSPQIIYKSDKKTESIINDVELDIRANASKIELKSYNIIYDDMKFFSTKASTIHMKENVIDISPLWVNNQLKVVGTYDTKTRKGDITTDASSLQIEHKFIKFESAVNIQTVLNGDKTSVKGKVVLLGGDIHYDLGTKSYPSDSDIIIIQDMKEAEANPFMDNLSINIDVTTKKPLIYKQGPIDIKANAHVSVHKSELADILVLGEVTLQKGGSYTFEGKKFVLDESKIYFTGNPNKPLLDINVKYKSLNYLITIGISGTPSAPNILFSSVPSLKKEQILSIILFDSAEGAGTNSGEDMMKMMGGAMAKSALADMGIKLDHLAIGADGSVEVGKKLTDKITFIYVNTDIPEVRVKYQHNSRVESVISTDEISQAYDIVYKRDFNADEIDILKKD